MTVTSDYLHSLDEYIEKLIAIVPTNISDNEVLNLESLLNDIYRYQLDLNGSTDLENAIIDALSQASELSDRIKKKPTLFRETSFFITQEVAKTSQSY